MYNIVVLDLANISALISTFINLLFTCQFYAYLSGFIPHNSLSGTVKLRSKTIRSRATCTASFETESTHISAFSDQTKYLRILVTILSTLFRFPLRSLQAVSRITLQPVYQRFAGGSRWHGG